MNNFYLSLRAILLSVLLIGFQLGCSTNNPTTPSPAPTPVPAPPSYSVLTFFGSSGPTSMASPMGVGVSGNMLWVSSPNNGYLQAWTLAGSFSMAITTYKGTSLNGPWGVYVGPDGYVYLADQGSPTAVEFSPTGIPVTNFGKAQSGTDPILGVAVSSSNAYLLNYASSLILRYTISGSGAAKVFNYQSSFGTTGPGTLNSPSGICVDNNSNLYVADSGNQRMVKFDSTGVFQMAVTTNSNTQDVAIDSSGDIYVSNWSSAYNVQIFSPSGAPLTQLGYPFFDCPSGLAFDASGNLYVVDLCNNQVVVLKKN